ncbi:MAG: aspartate aminotransferase family protein [Phototrophicales bacterium]|nr:MAG: aspartate aminotransferase family protein [Phototrophicales bacterium]
MATTLSTLHQAIQNEQTYIAQTYARPPFVLTHGEGMVVYDNHNKPYLDFVAGIAVVALGHSDPQISAIIQEQADKLIHVSNLYYTEPQGELAALLCQNSFADRVFFCNSGAEANEAALKFARKYAYTQGKADKVEIIAFSHAFHGRTMGALSVTPKPKYQDPFKPLLSHIKILPFNDIEAVKTHITEQTCAVIVEPIQGEGGIHPATLEFLQALRQQCDMVDAMLIFDEVQCGLGRTGDLWAHTFSGVHPDMMTLAKPLANGLPIGATLMTEKIHATLQVGDHGSTFAGGPLVTAVANHVVQRVRSPQMLEHVQAMGAYLQQKLASISSARIVDIRGRGLMVGIQLVDISASQIVEAGYDAGILLVNAGPDVIRIVPPLIVETKHIDVLIDFLSSVL